MDEIAQMPEKTPRYPRCPKETTRPDDDDDKMQTENREDTEREREKHAHMHTCTKIQDINRT